MMVKFFEFDYICNLFLRKKLNNNSIEIYNECFLFLFYKAHNYGVPSK